MSRKARKLPFVISSKKRKLNTHSGNLWELLDKVLANSGDSRSEKRSRQLSNSLSSTKGKRLQNLGIKYSDVE